jgi:hypothetical protein
LGLRPSNVGSKPSPMGVVVSELKAISVGFILSKAPVSILGPPPVTHSTPDPKGKAPVGSRGARAKFSFKLKTKLSHK